jgi:hypothetical protein
MEGGVAPWTGIWIRAGSHGQAGSGRCACRSAGEQAGCSELARQVRQYLIGAAQQPVARLDVDLAPPGSQPTQHTGAEPAATPPINSMLEQQQVQHGTGPVPK